MTTPKQDLDAWFAELSRKEFVKNAEARIGSVGALVEIRYPALFRVDGYSVDDWGAKIAVTHVQVPGLRDASTCRPEISSSWEGFST